MEGIEREERLEDALINALREDKLTLVAQLEAKDAEIAELKTQLKAVDAMFSTCSYRVQELTAMLEKKNMTKQECVGALRKNLVDMIDVMSRHIENKSIHEHNLALICTEQVKALQLAREVGIL